MLHRLVIKGQGIGYVCSWMHHRPIGNGTPILTIFQIHTGLQHGNINGGENKALPLHFPTLADQLQGLGYATHIVGKWHLGFYLKEYTPTYRGFDSFFGK